MAGFQILFEVVPELEKEPEDKLKRLWREWVNNQPPDVRLWLKDPLSPQQRRTLQCGFAAEYYHTHMLIAFENTQEERRQKLLAQDPRNQERRPILEALMDPADMVQRTLPNGRVVFTATTEEADVLEAHEAEKAAEPDVPMPQDDVPWVDPTSSGV